MKMATAGRFIRRNATGYIYLLPFLVLFVLFNLVPVISAATLSLQNYNMIQPARFVGLENYRTLILQDDIFLLSLKNTFLFALFIGHLGYMMSFLMAWLLNGMKGRKFFALCLYAPSIASGVAMAQVWLYLFSNDVHGFLNNLFLRWGFISTPILWNQNADTIFAVVIIISIWMSMGSGFLVFMAGLQNLPGEVMDQGCVDGIKNRVQELVYGSEMVFDTTAFESTQAVAHYTMAHGLPADVEGWYDKNLNGPGQGGYRSHPAIDPAKHVDFLHRQMKANIASRGTRMCHYAMQGSDFRAGGYKSYLLSYMSHMGGAAVLDYALYFDEDPARTLRAAYASMLSSWSLVNLGERDPWYPHKDNEGAVGWAFQPEDGGKTFPGFRCAYGPWPVDGEIDSGLSGAICASCSVLAKDPDFGLVLYGGEVREEDGALILSPRDGVRRAFHALHELPKRLHLSINRDAIKEIRLCGADEENDLVLQCENITGNAHSVALTINGMTHEIPVPARQAYSIVISRKEAAACV